MNSKVALLIGLSLIFSSFILAWGLGNVRNEDNFVTVKGLSERVVTADKAWLSINTKLSANSTDQMKNEIKRVETEIRTFLRQHRFTDSEINSPSLNIYHNNYKEATAKIAADFKISVSSDNIDKVKSAIKSTGDLIAKGILIQSDPWSAGPKYYFTKFKEVKKEMLAEATKEAKAAAQEFASNASSKVGKIRKANQGVFQILPKNKTQENEVFSSEKIIRVVCTVDYYLI